MRGYSLIGRLSKEAAKSQRPFTWIKNRKYNICENYNNKTNLKAKEIAVIIININYVQY